MTSPGFFFYTDCIKSVNTHKDLLTEEEVSDFQRTETVTSPNVLTYEDFRNAYSNIQGSLFGSAERYKTDLDWGDVAAKYDADEELKNVRNIFQLVRRYEQKYSEKW